MLRALHISPYVFHNYRVARPTIPSDTDTLISLKLPFTRSFYRYAGFSL